MAQEGETWSIYDGGTKKFVKDAGMKCRLLTMEEQVGDDGSKALSFRRVGDMSGDHRRPIPQGGWWWWLMSAPGGHGS